MYNHKKLTNILQTSHRSNISLRSSLNTSTQVLIDPAEHLVRLLTDTLMGRAQVARHVLHKVLLLTRLAAQNLPETICLDVILAAHRELLRDNGTSPFLMRLACFNGLVGQRAEGRGVVRVCTVVPVDIHVAIAVPRTEALQRAVDGDLFVVPAETVAVGIRVRKETRLQDRVGGGLDAGDHM